MNKWDILSVDFDTHKANTDIHPDVADNILIAWPSILKGIETTQKTGIGLRALDFGCGTGGFCKKLKSTGYDVIGCDTSEAMINIAVKNLGQKIAFFHGGSREVLHLYKSSLDLITAIMVFPFIKDISACIKDLSQALRPDGLLVFAVFNPDFVKKNLSISGIFKGIDTVTGLGNGHMQWANDIAIPTSIRSKDEYDQIMSSYGFQQIFADLPPFTFDYLAKYPTNFDTSCAEFLILAYKSIK